MRRGAEEAAEEEGKKRREDRRRRKLKKEGRHEDWAADGRKKETFPKPDLSVHPSPYVSSLRRAVLNADVFTVWDLKIKTQR